MGRREKFLSEAVDKLRADGVTASFFAGDVRWVAVVVSLPLGPVQSQSISPSVSAVGLRRHLEPATSEFPCYVAQVTDTLIHAVQLTLLQYFSRTVSWRKHSRRIYKLCSSVKIAPQQIPGIRALQHLCTFQLLHVASTPSPRCAMKRVCRGREAGFF